MDIGFAFADNIVKTNAVDLPPDVVEMTKKCILDLLGCIFAGGDLSADAENVVKMFVDAEGKEEATIIGQGRKVPSWSAAFSNGVLAHAIDFDDIVDETAVHPSLCTIPTALALAEKTGGVTGADFIAAVALGNDLICRLGAAIKRKQEGFVLGFRPAPVLGVFGAAAAGSKILQLDVDAVVDSLGIAFHQGAAGTFEAFLGGGDTKIRELYGGFIGMNGVLASLMAQRGITGIKTTFEGPAGLFNLYFQGKYDKEYLAAGLGRRFEGMNVCLKPWPANRMMHAPVQAALELVREKSIGPSDIKEITIYMLPGRMPKDGIVEMPKSSTAAKVNPAFCVASAIIDNGLGLKKFTERGLGDEKTRNLFKKVKFAEADFGNTNAFFPPGKVAISLQSGETHTKQVDLAAGHPQKPLTFNDVEDKFRDCVASMSSSKKVEQIIRIVGKLEEIDDMCTLLTAISHVKV